MGNKNTHRQVHDPDTRVCVVNLLLCKTKSVYEIPPHFHMNNKEINIGMQYFFIIYLFIAKHLSCLEFALVSSSTIITNIKIQTQIHTNGYICSINYKE